MRVLVDIEGHGACVRGNEIVLVDRGHIGAGCDRVIITVVSESELEVTSVTVIFPVYRPRLIVMSRGNIVRFDDLQSHSETLAVNRQVSGLQDYLLAQRAVDLRGHVRIELLQRASAALRALLH